ncbi:MAG: PilZ domain-containing protein [Deltaproteobacteria bacterium]|nr:PilZ domain-containing protein [Deltaproteobacteria bacterium]
MNETSPLEPEGGPGEARRQFRSARKLRWPVDAQPVHRTAEGDPGRIRAQTLGISLGGAFIVSDVVLPVDTDLHLWVHPPQPPPGGPTVLRLLARVRWTNEVAETLPRGYGVAFRALTAMDEIALHTCFSRSAKVV